jgi:uncharacterized protein YecT (DUF1311 family)
MVGEACAHVQGESLKAYAALLTEASQLPDHQGREREVRLFKIASVLLACASLSPVALAQSPEASASQEQTLVPRGSEKPSFDCAQAKTAAARLICADAELARLDRELGVAFQKRKARIPAPDQPKFVAAQLAWIRDRNTRCELVGKTSAAIEVLASSRPCMVSVIQERITFLAQPETAVVLVPTGVQQPITSQSAAQSQTPMDNVLAAALADCDQIAERDTAVATTNETSPLFLLNPYYAIGMVPKVLQEQGSRPSRLAAIEQQREQCRQSAVAAATQRATQRTEEARNQEREQALGYQHISLETFLLDGKDLAAREAKVSLSGVLVREGNVDVLYADAAAMWTATHYPNRGNQLEVPLLTDDASRDFRQYLLRCQSNPGGCSVTVLGHATICKLSNAFGATRELPCVAAEEGR